jgi:hypothetical protein
MTAFLRVFFLIPIAYILAVFAATLVLLIGSTRSVPVTDTERLVLTFFGAAVVGGFALLPMLLAIIVSESARWRSIVAWVLFGGALGLVGWLLPFNPPPDYHLDSYVAVYVGSGFAGGFVYWLIAGRQAGLGFGRRAAPPDRTPPAAG